MCRGIGYRCSGIITTPIPPFHCFTLRSTGGGGGGAWPHVPPLMYASDSGVARIFQRGWGGGGSRAGAKRPSGVISLWELGRGTPTPPPPSHGGDF